MSAYAQFLARKTTAAEAGGMVTIPPINPQLFPHQRDGVEFALRIGRAAIFYDTGLGKTLVELEWARIVAAHTGRPVLILAPLAVAAQTVREAAKFGIEAKHVHDASEVINGVNVTNYHKLHKFDAAVFGGVVLDESSILKSFDGTTRNMLVDAFDRCQFKLAATATPAPNDHMELGNHAEFLGVLSMREMLSRWFVNDAATASQNWRLKKHAEAGFWSWVASWSISCGMPSDLGHSDDGFVLPPCEMIRHVVETDLTLDRGDTLFRMPKLSATSINKEKRRTMGARVDALAKLVNGSAEPWVIWTETNFEADLVGASLPGAIEVRGSDKPEDKESRLIAFSEGSARVITTKARIAGFGLNWQHCARMAFVGVGFSYEGLYQAIRRCWRFGQKRPVQVHIFMAETEGAIWDVLQRKMADHDRMKAAMRSAIRGAQQERPAWGGKPFVPVARPKLPTWLRAS